MKKSWALLVFVCFCAALDADTGSTIDIPARARGASRIVIGRISDVVAQFETNRFGDQLIISNATVEVSETLKGSPVAVLQVSVEGGTVGDLTLKVSDMPALKPGDRALFFLESDAGREVPHDRGRGILKIAADDRIQGTDRTLSDVRAQVRSALQQGGR